MRTILAGVMLLLMMLASDPSAFAQEKEGGKPAGPPPAIVVTAPAEEGMIAPEGIYIGTIYYREVSEVASEVSGKVEAVFFEEGDKVKKGGGLVRIDAELLERELESTRSTHAQELANLEKARKDFERNKALFAEKLISEREYDDYRFAVKVLENRAASLDAEVKRLEAELQKKVIPAPYNGVVVSRHVDRGEWLSAGSPVATVAMDEVLDVVVNVPESVIRFARTGAKVAVEAGGRSVEGEIIAVIKRGDISTRTFPVKVRLKGGDGLYEGMEARVRLPEGPRRKTVVVNRDAVISKFGNMVVYKVSEGKAEMVPVKVVGYEGLKAGIVGQGLAPGAEVVIKGNERLQPGQSVMSAGPGGAPKGADK